MGLQQKREICKGLDDREIVARSLEDLDYFACLYEKYESRLLSYIRQISFAGEDEAMDILQEAFIKIWRHLNDYDHTMRLSSWVYRIVRNETISHFRKMRSFGKNRTTDPETYYENWPVQTDDEEERELRSGLTHEVLGRMPLKYREVLVLKFFEKNSYSEISDILKIPEGTVAIRISRAKKIFRVIAENMKTDNPFN